MEKGVNLLDEMFTANLPGDVEKLQGGPPMRELTIGKNDAGQRLDRFLGKAMPLRGFHSRFWYRYAWMWLMRVLTFSVSSAWTTMPGRLSAKN